MEKAKVSAFNFIFSAVLKVFLSSVLLAVSLSACDFKEEPYVDFDKSSYNKAIQKWESLNASNYTFTYQISSDATGPGYPKVVVTVTDGVSSYKVVSGYGDETEEELKHRFNENDARFVSAEYLFSFINELYEDACTQVKKRPEGLVSVDVDVKYDQKTGFPTYISSAGSWTTSMDGDWWSMKITDIEILD